MGNSTHYIHTKAGALLPAEAYAGSLSEDEIENAFRFPVDLAAIPSKAFDLLVRHGYEVADATLTTYLSKEFQTRHALPF
jgi:NTE family protein